MPPGETLRLALRAIRANLLRSALTMLGIVIGVAAVIVMLAIGDGAQNRVAEQLRALGSNLLMVRPGAARDGAASAGAGSRDTLTEEDARAIAAEIPTVLVAAPTVAGVGRIVHGNRNWEALVGGVTADYLTAREWAVGRGRPIVAADESAAAKVALLGATTAERLFEQADPLGATVRIANVPFTVIGVLAPKGAASAAGRDQDDVALIPLATAKLRVLGARSMIHRSAVDFIMVKLGDAAEPAATQAAIERLLRQRHRIGAGEEADFQVQEPSATMEAQAAAAQSMTLFLGIVAAVSVVVGGISIMNIMLVSVTERTREIGLRQALGARRREVRDQFLIEAVLLCLLGGVAGVVLGAGVAVALTQSLGWPVSITPQAVLLALGFATAVGIAFGYYPAAKASRLDPIEALRFE
jgi:putative ABC transport system permease protein